MVGVYIHIPFCKTFCSYCDFCKLYYETGYVSKYLEALEYEIKDRYNGEPIDTLYIGGGTPSCLSIDELNRLLEIVSLFNLKENYEFTIECNIENIDIDKINIFKSYGINRISFGVQSFDNDIIKILERNHDENVVFDNVLLTKKYFDNINIDLIYGVNNKIDIVKKDIELFLELDIPHISCYSLILEEHTKLYINNYKNISTDIDADMFQYIDNILRKNGYHHYEISNYAKDGYESKHNKNYWMNGFYYGFGLSAVSFLDNYRISNTKNMHEYLNHNFVYTKEYEDVNIRKENDLILGLRMIDGININDFNCKYDVQLENKEIIMKLIENEKLEIRDGFLKCKNDKIYLMNNILIEIIGSEL